MRYVLPLLLLAACTTPATDDSRPHPRRRPDTGSGDTTPTETAEPGDTVEPDDTGTSALECDPSVEGWPGDWAALEEEVLAATNEVRARGANCGEYGRMPATDPLQMEPHLRCAARVHALDMGTRDYFSHDSQGGPLGRTFDQRIVNAGFSGTTLGENIAAGYPTAQDTVDGWVDSDGHCSNLMNADFRYIGVGYASVRGSTYGSYWVQDFGG